MPAFRTHDNRSQLSQNIKKMKNCEWEILVTHLNNFWTLTPYISKSPLHTISICMSWLIKSRTMNSSLRRKRETEIVLAAILMKNRKNGPKLNIGHFISKIRQHTIPICLSFSIKSTTMNSSLKRKPEMEVVLSAIMEKNGQKSREICPCFANLRPSRTREAPAMPPARRSNSEYPECSLLTNTAMTSAVTNFWCYKLITIVNK